MSGYLSRLKALKSEMPPKELLTKPAKPPFVSFGSNPDRHFSKNTTIDPPPSKAADANTAVVAPVTLETALWTNPYKQGTPAARQESLLQCMEAIWVIAFDRVKAIWPQGFLSTPEICEAEIEVERVHALVLSGKAKLKNFRGAVEAWEQIVNQKINIF